MTNNNNKSIYIILYYDILLRDKMACVCVKMWCNDMDIVLVLLGYINNVWIILFFHFKKYIVVIYPPLYNCQEVYIYIGGHQLLCLKLVLR